MTVNTDYDRHDTPADPAAIELDQIKFLVHRHGILSGSEPMRLIAAVEALRERVAETEIQLSMHSKWLGEALSRAEAETARVVELAGALEFYAADDARSVEAGILESLNKRPATAVLAATPAQALARVAAWKICETIIREREQDIRFLHLTVQRERELKKALITLGKLGKEES